MLTPYGKREIILSIVFASLLFGVCFVLFAITGRSVFRYLISVPLLIILFTLFFFRDPKRKITYRDCAILSPCDGYVTHIDTAEEPYFFKGKAQRVSIFMTMFDVHVQRSPINGEVIFLEHHPGQFLNAQKEASLSKNENNVIGIKTDHGFPILVKQIAGVFARRIVCRVNKGDRITQGEKIGMVKFGSRGEIWLPLDIEFEVLVKKGEHVKGGLTVLGRVKNCP